MLTSSSLTTIQSFSKTTREECLDQDIAADQTRCLRKKPIVRSQAMHASTIAEYAIEEGGVSLDLEIGPGDIEAFANLLPDELYERLGGDPKPWSERLATFFENAVQTKLDLAPNFVRGQLVRPDRLTIDMKHTEFQKLAYKRDKDM